MLLGSPFRPAWWLPGAHAQTLFPHLLRRTPAPPLRAERLELPDGDFVDLAWGPEHPGPLICVFHGLEGSAESSYARGLLAALDAGGFAAVLMHFRGCSGAPNRLPRAYHSGDTGDIRSLLEALGERFPGRALGAAGFSLGANALLCHLGQAGEDSGLAAAAGVSPPLVLHEASRRLNSGLSRVYERHLLRSLKQKAAERLPMHPGCAADLEAAKAARSFREYDDAVTAPLHGFESADDYFTRASCRQYLGGVRTPTLVLHAADDPFVTPAVVPTEAELSADVRFELSARGGHVGFVEGRWPWRAEYFVDRRLVEWFGRLK